MTTEVIGHFSSKTPSGSLTDIVWTSNSTIDPGTYDLNATFTFNLGNGEKPETSVLKTGFKIDGKCLRYN